MTSSSVSKAKLTNSDLEVDLIVVPVCKFWFPAGKYWLAIFSTASLAIWRLWARLAMSQGNLLRGIDNLQSVNRPWATVSVTHILYFNRFINILYNHEYHISSYKARRYYSFTRPLTACIIRTRVLIEGWCYYQNFINLGIKTRQPWSIYYQNREFFAWRHKEQN